MERNSDLESEIAVAVGKMILFVIPPFICAYDISAYSAVFDDKTFLYYLTWVILIGFLIAEFIQTFSIIETVDRYKKWFCVVNHGQKYCGKTYCDISHGSYTTGEYEEAYPILLDYEGENIPVSAGIMAPLNSAFNNADCEVYELNNHMVIRIYTEYGYTEISTRKFI